MRTKTIKEKIVSYDINFDDTIQIFNKALSYFMKVINTEIVDLTDISTKEIVNVVDKTIACYQSESLTEISVFRCDLL